MRAGEMRGGTAQAQRPDGCGRRTSPHGIARIAHGRFISVRQGAFNARAGALLHTAAMVGSPVKTRAVVRPLSVVVHRQRAALHGRAVGTSAWL
jgi:hypothetical protein